MATSRKVHMPSPVRRQGNVTWYASEADAQDAVVILTQIGNIEGHDDRGRRPDLDSEGQFAVVC